jgi:hypothetical protein
MSSRRAFTALGIAILVAALAAPLAAAACGGGDSCPMMKSSRSAHAGSCATRGVLSPAMDCCRQSPAPAANPASSAVTAPQLAAPLPAEGRDSGDALASLDAAAPVPVSPQLACAERRHDLGLQALNSVFLI